MGTRKWFSYDASYASDYGGGYAGASSPGGLLWVCRTKVEIPAFVGRQASLAAKAPWEQHEFPWKLPNAFESYAQSVLQLTGPVALLDHPREEGYREILITSPEQAIEVLEVIQLPRDLAEARSLGREMNQKYARERLWQRVLLPSPEIS